MDIKPIETEYNGYRFRSRLEARWAVLFDALDIKYEYEPEGYKLPDGQMYLPDFVLYGGEVRCPDTLFVEVKGQMSIQDANKVQLFSGECPMYHHLHNGCEECKHFRYKMDQDHKGYSHWCNVGIEIDTFENWDGYTYWHPDFEGKPIYLVTHIPENIKDIANGIDIEGTNISYYNFHTVDRDYFGAVLGAKKGGGWGLFGADSNYWVDMDEEATQAAYTKARQARFEHGEKPNI